MSIISVPFAASPKILVPAKYIPVALSLRNEYDGAPAIPLIALNELDEEEFRIYKNSPSLNIVYVLPVVKVNGD
jgi:hypothetical protein